MRSARLSFYLFAKFGGGWGDLHRWKEKTIRGQVRLTAPMLRVVFFSLQSQLLENVMSELSVRSFVGLSRHSSGAAEACR